MNVYDSLLKVVTLQLELSYQPHSHWQCRVYQYGRL